MKCCNNEDKQQNCLARLWKFNGTGDNRVPFMWIVEPLQELLGHEGSIYRLSWSEDGLCVASASDDRRSVMLFELLPYGRLMICAEHFNFFPSNFDILDMFLSTWFTRNDVHHTDFLSGLCTFCSFEYSLLLNIQVSFYIRSFVIGCLRLWQCTDMDKII